jgi:hypothetical protein
MKRIVFTLVGICALAGAVAAIVARFFNKPKKFRRAPLPRGARGNLTLCANVVSSARESDIY